MSFTYAEFLSWARTQRDDLYDITDEEINKKLLKPLQKPLKEKLETIKHEYDVQLKRKHIELCTELIQTGIQIVRQDTDFFRLMLDGQLDISGSAHHVTLSDPSKFHILKDVPSVWLHRQGGRGERVIDQVRNKVVAKTDHKEYEFYVSFDRVLTSDVYTLYPADPAERDLDVLHILDAFTDNYYIAVTEDDVPQWMKNVLNLSRLFLRHTVHGELQTFKEDRGVDCATLKAFASDRFGGWCYPHAPKAVGAMVMVLPRREHPHDADPYSQVLQAIKKNAAKDTTATGAGSYLYHSLLQCSEKAALVQPLNVSVSGNSEPALYCVENYVCPTPLYYNLGTDIFHALLVRVKPKRVYNGETELQVFEDLVTLVEGQRDLERSLGATMYAETLLHTSTADAGLRFKDRSATRMSIAKRNKSLWEFARQLTDKNYVRI